MMNIDEESSSGGAGGGGLYMAKCGEHHATSSPLARLTASGSSGASSNQSFESTTMSSPEHVAEMLELEAEPILATFSNLHPANIQCNCYDPNCKLKKYFKYRKEKITSMNDDGEQSDFSEVEQQQQTQHHHHHHHHQRFNTSQSSTTSTAAASVIVSMQRHLNSNSSSNQNKSHMNSSNSEQNCQKDNTKMSLTNPAESTTQGESIDRIHQSFVEGTFSRHFSQCTRLALNELVEQAGGEKVALSIYDCCVQLSERQPLILSTTASDQGDTVLMQLCSRTFKYDKKAEKLLFGQINAFIRIYIERDPSLIFVRNSQGTNALELAGLTDKKYVAKYIARLYAEFGRDVNESNSQGHTVLHLLARKGDDCADTLEELLKLRKEEKRTSSSHFSEIEKDFEIQEEGNEMGADGETRRNKTESSRYYQHHQNYHKTESARHFLPRGERLLRIDVVNSGHKTPLDVAVTCSAMFTTGKDRTIYKQVIGLFHQVIEEDANELFSSASTSSVSSSQQNNMDIDTHTQQLT